MRSYLVNRPSLTASFAEVETFPYPIVSKAFCAIGNGPVRDFSMRVDRKPVGIEFADGVDDAAAEWQFEQFHPSEDHKIAVAVRREPGTLLEIVCRETAPGPS